MPVDVGPSQPADLTTAGAGPCEYAQQCTELGSVIIRGSEQLARDIHWRWCDLASADLGRARTGGRVVGDPPPLHRLTECTAQDRVVVTDSRRGQPLLAGQAGVVAVELLGGDPAQGKMTKIGCQPGGH